MARVPQEASVDVQVAVRELNDELTTLKRDLKDAKSSIPSTKAVEELQGAVTRLSKTPTYLDPNDVFRGSGPAHMHGYVPDPGESAGTDSYLREDGTWAVPPGGGGGVTDHPDLTGRSDSDQHPATAITNTAAGLIAATTVQAALNELDGDKLARSGEQTWVGPSKLDMNHFGVDNVDDADIEGTATVGEDVIFTEGAGGAKVTDLRALDFKSTATGEALITGVRGANFNQAVQGEGVIDQPRAVHMAGDDDNNEARIDGLERVKFNDEPTKSVIENPSRLEWNPNVEAGVDYTPVEGRASWDNLEDTMVVWVASGAELVAVAFGWSVKLAASLTLPS